MKKLLALLLALALTFSLASCLAIGDSLGDALGSGSDSGDGDGTAGDGGLVEVGYMDYSPDKKYGTNSKIISCSNLNDKVYLAADDKLITNSADGLTVRLYYGVEDDVKSIHDLESGYTAKLRIWSGSPNGETKTTQLSEGFLLDDAVFVDYDNCYGYFSGEHFKRYIDVTVPREVLPELYDESLSTDLSDINLGFELSIKFEDDFTKSRCYQLFTYSEKNGKARLTLPILSEEDESLYREALESLLEERWFDYKEGTKSFFTAESSNDTEGVLFDVYEGLTVDFTDYDYLTERYIDDFPLVSDGVIFIKPFSLEDSDGCVDTLKYGISFAIHESILEAWKNAGRRVRLVAKSNNNIGEVIVLREIEDIYTNSDYVLNADELKDKYLVLEDAEGRQIGIYDFTNASDFLHSEIISLPESIFTLDPKASVPYEASAPYYDYNANATICVDTRLPAYLRIGLEISDDRGNWYFLTFEKLPYYRRGDRIMVVNSTVIRKGDEDFPLN